LIRYKLLIIDFVPQNYFFIFTYFADISSMTISKKSRFIK
jgi:hypothetical protein